MRRRQRRRRKGRRRKRSNRSRISESKLRRIIRQEARNIREANISDLGISGDGETFEFLVENCSRYDVHTTPNRGDVSLKCFVLPNPDIMVRSARLFTTGAIEGRPDLGTPDLHHLDSGHQFLYHSDVWEVNSELKGRRINTSGDSLYEALAKGLETFAEADAEFVDKTRYQYIDQDNHIDVSGEISAEEFIDNANIRTLDDDKELITGIDPA